MVMMFKSPRRVARIGLAFCGVALIANVLTVVLGTSLAAQETSGRASGGSGAAPVIVTPADQAALMEMSVRQWRAYNQQREAEKFSEAQAATPYTLVLPKPPPSAHTNVDVWSRTRFDSAVLGAPTHGYTSDAGSDIAVGKDVRVGASVHLDKHAGPSAGETNSYMAGPYVGLQVAPNVTVDAKTAWGASRDANAKNGLAVRDRQESSAQVSGAWTWNTVTVAPSAAVVHNKERQRGGTSARDARTRLDLRPELRRPIELDSGDVIEPFVNAEGSVELGGSGSAEHAGDGGLGKVGAGVSYSHGSDYSLRATTGVEGFGAQDDREVKGRVDVTVPLD